MDSVSIESISEEESNKNEKGSIKKSSDNLKRRLSNLQEIDKSLNSFREESNQLNWKELQKINKEIVEEQEF